MNSVRAAGLVLPSTRAAGTEVCSRRQRTKANVLEAFQTVLSFAYSSQIGFVNTQKRSEEVVPFSKHTWMRT